MTEKRNQIPNEKIGQKGNGCTRTSILEGDDMDNFLPEEKLNICRLLYLGASNTATIESKSVEEDLERAHTLGGYDALDYYEFVLISLKRLFNADSTLIKECIDVEDIGELPEEMKSKIESNVVNATKKTIEIKGIIEEMLEAEGLEKDMKELRENYGFKK